MIAARPSVRPPQTPSESIHKFDDVQQLTLRGPAISKIPGLWAGPSEFGLERRGRFRQQQSQSRRVGLGTSLYSPQRCLALCSYGGRNHKGRDFYRTRCQLGAGKKIKIKTIRHLKHSTVSVLRSLIIPISAQQCSNGVGSPPSERTKDKDPHRRLFVCQCPVHLGSSYFLFFPSEFWKHGPKDIIDHHQRWSPSSGS